MIVKSLRAFVCSSTCDHEARHCGQQQARVGLYLDVTIGSQTRGCGLETLELERESSCHFKPDGRWVTIMSRWCTGVLCTFLIKLRVMLLKRNYSQLLYIVQKSAVRALLLVILLSHRISLNKDTCLSEPKFLTDQPLFVCHVS